MIAGVTNASSYESDFVVKSMLGWITHDTARVRTPGPQEMCGTVCLPDLRATPLVSLVQVSEYA